MRILALDAALGCCSAAALDGMAVLAERREPGGRGQSAVLPGLARQVLRDSATDPAALDAVAVTIGPGSFTGIRAALALAHGLALGAGCELLAVTVAEALAAALPLGHGRAVWTAIDSRRGRIFLDIDGAAAGVALDALPQAVGPVAVTGDAAIPVAARLAARGVDVLLTAARLPQAGHVGQAALRRRDAGLAARPAQPLYIDPPEARPPAGGLRPAPLPP